MCEISIIIPVYNVEEYLSKCIDSVLAQTFSDYEIILVDDGSPDNSPKICDNYAAKDRRIKVIHQKNGGLSAARNAGLAIANGKYILFVDSDDYISPNMLEVMYSNTKQTNADIVVSSVVKVDKNGRIIRIERIIKEENDKYEYLQDKYGTGIGIYDISCGKLYKKYLFDNIRFPIGKINEDAFVVNRLIHQCKRITKAERAEYFYLQHNESIMNRKYSVKRLDGIEACIGQAKFLQENKYPQEVVNAAVNSIFLVLEGSYLEASKCMHGEHKNYKKRYKELYREFRKVIKPCLGSNMKLLRKLKMASTYVFPELTLRYVGVNAKKVYGVIIGIKNKRLCYKKYIEGIKKECNNNHKRMFLLYTPLYANLGDQAIRTGEISFLKRYFPKCKIIEVNETIIFEDMLKSLKKFIKPTDVMLIQGGGFVGDMWPAGNKDIQKIVDVFNKNNVVVLPNTSHYYNKEEGRRCKQADVNFFKEHQKAYMCFRDRASYDDWSEAIGKDRCGYFPDMAMMVDYKPHTSKKDILLCFRKDHEKVQSNEQIENLENIINGLNKNFSYTDTVIEETQEFRSEQAVRDKAVKDKLDEFAGAELIITNRLHGMVMSAIAGTPCIALDNLSKKVSGVYEWIKYLNYIKIATIEEINADMIKEMMSKKNCVFDRKPIEKDFERLSEKIKTMLS